MDNTENKYKYYYVRFTREQSDVDGEPKTLYSWDVTKEHRHPDHKIDEQIADADNRGIMMCIPWKESENKYGLDIMSKSTDRLHHVKTGFQLALKFEASVLENYKIWTQQLEANRANTEKSSLD